MYGTQICRVADANPKRSRVFANSRRISFFFLFRLLFGCVLATVCEAQLRLCVKFFDYERFRIIDDLIHVHIND